MNPVTYKGKTIQCERDGPANDADGRPAMKYKVSIDGDPAFTFVPLGPGLLFFIETAQEMIDNEVDMAR